jgi:hypothetical protein
MTRGIPAVLVCAALTGLLLISTLHAQEKRFSVAARANITTGSQLFFNPNAIDPIDRAQYYALKDIWGVGGEFRYHIPETDLVIGISVEYLHTSTGRDIRVSSTRYFTEEDGYRVVPIELTGYFLIPISGPTLGIYMGGGGGAYFGRRTFKRAGVEAESAELGHGLGIHVLGGVSYRFTDYLALNGEMKFRDLQFTTANRFTVASTTFNGMVVPLPTDRFESRIHTDGIVFQLAAVFSF